MLTRVWLVPLLVGCACPRTACGLAGKPNRTAGSASHASFLENVKLAMLRHAACMRAHG